MTRASMLTAVLVMLAGCGGSSPPSGPATDDAYDSCDLGDNCLGGTVCSETTLTSGYSGDLCTNSCNVDSDCSPAPSGFDPVCVSTQNSAGQCYVTCPSSDACPYGQGCFPFTDQNGNPISLCTP